MRRACSDSVHYVVARQLSEQLLVNLRNKISISFGIKIRQLSEQFLKHIDYLEINCIFAALNF